MRTTSPNPTALFKVIVITGLIAGTLDALAAILDYYIVTGKNPVIIFIFIASGALGKQAFTMSQSVALLGLLFHYCIATIFCAFYFFIYPKIKWLQRDRLASAVVYGVFVCIVMNLVVVPLSNIPPLPFHFLKALKAAAILVICIGVPNSFRASRFYQKASINAFIRSR